MLRLAYGATSGEMGKSFKCLCLAALIVPATSQPTAGMSLLMEACTFLIHVNLGHNDTVNAPEYCKSFDFKNITVYDASISKPTELPGQIVWIDDTGAPACTYTEAIKALPTSLLDLPGVSGEIMTHQSSD